MTQVALSLKDIYRALCPECKTKIVKMVQDQLTSAAVKDALEGKDQPRAGGKTCDR